jgi:hypothetical protein
MTDAQKSSEASKSSSPLSAAQLNRLLNFAFIVGCLAVFVLITFANVAEPDIWGHTRFGEDILRLRQIPTADPYSYVNQGFFCIDHEWLFDVMMACWYQLSGVLGLVLFKGLLVAALVGLLILPLRQAGFGLFPGAFVILFALQVMGPGIVVIRPHLFTYLFFAAVCLILREATIGSSKWLWLLPVIIIPWANIHGGFLSGLSVILAWAVVQSIVLFRAGDRMVDIRRIWLVVIVSFAAHLVNPFGPRLLEFLVPVIRSMQLEIGEWNPLAINSESGMYYLACCAAMLLSLFFTERKRQPSFVVIMSLMLIAPLSAKRHLALLVIAMIVFGAEHLASVTQQLARALQLKSFSDFSWHGKLVMTVAFLVTAGYIVPQVARIFGRIVPMRGLPVASVNLLKELKVEGNMVPFFDWGEYIIYHLGPRVKVSIDGRRETAYPINVYRDNVAFTDGVYQWDAILERYPSNMVLIPKGLACYSLMKLKPGWTLVYEDDSSSLFIRNGSPVIAQIQERLKTGKPIDSTETGFP